MKDIKYIKIYLFVVYINLQVKFVSLDFENELAP